MDIVLIVEDETLEQEFIKAVVLDELHPGGTVLTCESGVEAIQLAKKYQPNIIIMDLMISEIDGLTAIEEIRKFLPDACITILSAYSDFSYAQKGISLGVFEYLLKPVKPIVFREMFQKMLKSACSAHELIDKNKMESNQDPKNFIRESLEYINDHFKERLTLKMVASQVFMNSKYFSQVFKKEMGVTFTEYIIQLKIQHACRLLETTNFPAYRISAECGFSDPSYFNRVFCAKMNMTPQTYRKHEYTITPNNDWSML